jgi:2-iminobutanoate/2-iminopropanoate deaminase
MLINGTLFISGQLSVNPETWKLEGDTMTEQAERVIKNVEILCKKAGMDLSHVVSTTVYISDFNEFKEFNKVFVKMFPTAPPTRATVQVARLAADAKIEISAIAMKQN